MNICMHMNLDLHIEWRNMVMWSAEAIGPQGVWRPHSISKPLQYLRPVEGVTPPLPLPTGSARRLAGGSELTLPFFEFLERPCCHLEALWAPTLWLLVLQVASTYHTFLQIALWPINLEPRSLPTCLPNWFLIEFATCQTFIFYTLYCFWMVFLSLGKSLRRCCSDPQGSFKIVLKI